MATTRVIYQTDAIFAGQVSATGNHMSSGTVGNLVSQMSGLPLINQLARIQDASWDATATRLDVNQFGELARIDAVIIEQPNVTFNFSYLLANLANEKNIGLTVTPTGQTYSSSCLSGILAGLTNEKNYWILQAAQGQDANGNASLNTPNTKVYGLSNMFLSSYEARGAVGELPTVSVSLEGLNYVIQTGIQFNTIPAVQPSDGSRITGFFYRLPTPASHANPGSGDLTISALRPSDMQLFIREAGTTTEYTQLGATPSTISGAPQSYSFSYNSSYDTLQKLGSKFGYSKEITFPLTVNCSVDLKTTDVNVGDFSEIICDDKSYDIELNILKPGCEANRPIIAKYRLLGAKADTQTNSLSIGSDQTATLNFSAQIGGPQQTGVGLFLSGHVGN